jgi:hypothetical protein
MSEEGDHLLHTQGIPSPDISMYKFILCVYVGTS